MEPLFPDDRPAPAAPLPRWVRVVATLDARGNVLATQVDVSAVDGTLLMSRGFWPTSGLRGTLTPIDDALRFAQELVMD